MEDGGSSQTVEIWVDSGPSGVVSVGVDIVSTFVCVCVCMHACMCV